MEVNFMKKKIAQSIGVIVLIAIVMLAIFNIHSWIVSGNQYIKISTPSKAYTNSDLYVSVIAQDKGVDIDTKTKLKLVDSNGKRVKDVNIKYDRNNAILSIPQIEAGKYYIEAKVSSKAGQDKVEKEIYISNGNTSNVTITFDKGIYKPGDTVSFRALLTSKENDEPISSETNVSIYDGNDNRVYNETIKSSDYGIISGNFLLANEVNSGLYKLVVKTENNEVTKQFKVNPYVNPKYEVKINYDKENYLVGETAKITFDAKYFFGEAVQNANLKVYINNKENKVLKTDIEGIATMDYTINEAKQYNIKVEAVDTSNYYVEATSSFTAGTDIFEIKLLPEYGTLVAGKKNDVYIFTSKADGTPLKTYVTVTSNNNFTKQVATDENGIGRFSVDVDAITNSTKKYYYGSYNTTAKNTQQFTISAEDTNGNKINKNISLNVENKNLLLSTNKVKYGQGEDIKINISSTTENEKNIYLFKNDKLIKMVSTNSEDTTVNLENTYGLIDIYVTEKNGSNSSNTYKKTIFIKPQKELNISISTDKNQYMPGDKIGISFNTTDENKTGVDAALLISMLDNSILSLANNDLSIDNIKLALQDIKFTNELDGATLYSSIINDSSEQTMMALLLKQNNKDISVSEIGIYNHEQKEKSAIISVILIVAIVIIVLTVLCIKFKKAREVFKHIINCIIFELLLLMTTQWIMDEYFWRADINEWIIAGITTIVGLAVYIALLSRINEKIYRTSFSIIISCILITLVLILYYALELSPIIIISILAVTMLILAILSRISEAKKLKINKYLRVVNKEIFYILKYFGAVVISVIAGIIIQDIFDVDVFTVIGIIVCIYLLNYIFNKLGEEDVKEKTQENQKMSKPIFYIIVALAVVGIMAIGYAVISAISGEKYYGYDTPIREYYTEESTTGKKYYDPSNFNAGADTVTSNAKSNGTLSILENAAESLLSGNKDATNSVDGQDSSVTPNKESVTDENIRNVFLESMCFIPELVTTNGKANLDLNLSDNITTWTIQTVGNTKDGKIGYGVIDNVKVFKEFFADFELPKNLLETDNVSIPVTIYNYTEDSISTILSIKQEDWFTINTNNINMDVNAKSSGMVYIPITVIKSGNNKFRAEISSNGLTDIVEKECTVTPKGYKQEKVVSTGILDEDITEDILVLDDFIENTAKAKVKIYSSTMAQTVEGMENIFRMPTGCFEQISSSLYPNILALKYMEDNGIVDEAIKTKAISYITSGYQKLLTYEVKGESGGYSLYGQSPAETVLTAYGLMELTDLSKVYSVDENVLNKMTEFLYKQQNTNGTFTITGSHLGGANSREELSLNAYITWALSESNPKDSRLDKSVLYLKNKLNDIEDNYTLALVANILANKNDKEVNDVLKRLVNNVNMEGNNAYLTSYIKDYYGSRANVQTIQTVALTSMALSKAAYNPDTNKLLINYIISKKDIGGTWYSTQATILALKALNERSEKNNLENQTIRVKVNSNEQSIEIKDNPLQLYELTFEGLSKENKLNIDIEKGNAYYEVIEEYYIPYDKVETKNDNIEVKVECNNELRVNEILQANIKVINRSGNSISNGMVTISIPQGFTVVEDSLMYLESKGIIEKYETSYTEINIYLRDFDVSQIVDLNVNFRASYPVDINGLSIKTYDYYNPEVEGKSLPVEIKVNQ